jgi:hypothetical protein
VKPTWCTFIHFIKSYGPPHVSSITCSSSGGATQTALAVFRACYVSWLHQVQVTDIAPSVAAHYVRYEYLNKMQLEVWSLSQREILGSLSKHTHTLSLSLSLSLCSPDTIHFNLILTLSSPVMQSDIILLILPFICYIFLGRKGLTLSGPPKL